MSCSTASFLFGTFHGKTRAIGWVGLLLALTMFFAPRPAHTCKGTPRPPMCPTTGVIVKSVPGVFLSPTTPNPFPVAVTVILTCTPQNCATFSPGTVTVALVPVGGGPVVATATVGFTPFAGCSPNGTAYPLTVNVPIPANLVGLFTAVGTFSVPVMGPTFPPNSFLANAGDTVTCFVEQAPGQPGVPRLDMDLINPLPSNPFMVVGPGSQVAATYRLKNNDPVESVTVTVTATSKQAARMPTGNPSVYSIASPVSGDDFPIAFDAEGCDISLPDDPASFTQPPITQTVTLAPGQMKDIKVGSRSFPGCASGSCSEEAVIAEGSFENGDPVVACASTAHIVQVGLPNSCCGQPDATCPTCNMAGPFTNGMGQSYIEVTLQDTESGLGFIIPTQQSNISVPDPGLMYGTTSPVVVTATKQDQSQKASVQLTVVDACGNKILCDPVVTDVLRPNGAPAEQTHTNLPAAEHFIRVINGTPGLQKLDVIVNGERYQLKGLYDGEERTLDVAASMLPGDGNTITFRATGKPGGGATVVISDSE